MRKTSTSGDAMPRSPAPLCEERGAAPKDLANDALCHGPAEMTVPPKRREPFRTRSVDSGRPLLPDIDNVAEALATVEGDAFH